MPQLDERQRRLFAASEARAAGQCELDDKFYPKGIVVSDEDMRNINIQNAGFHGEWNYTIAPSTPLIEAVDS